MKKHLIRAVIILAAAAILVSAAVIAVVRRYHSQEGLRFVKHLGYGINLGNSLDVYGAAEYLDDPSVEDFETFWHNPPISEKLLKSIKAEGFRTVRIPVSWGEHMDEAGKVDKAWMKRVDKVVRKSLDLGLNVILDAHHEPWLELKDNKESDARFAFLWEQIAVQFADCGEELLFESVNEPRLRDSSLEWSGGSPELRAGVERLNRIFTDTVRSVEGNESRWLLVPTYCNRPEKEAMTALTLPDKRCIASIHIYEPYDFCQKTKGDDEWNPGGSDAENLLKTFEQIEQLLVRRNIPVIITECGCVDKHNEADRILWVQTLRKGADRCGTVCLWWDNGDEYQLLDRKTGKVRFSRLLRAFLKG